MRGARENDEGKGMQGKVRGYYELMLCGQESVREREKILEVRAVARAGECGEYKEVGASGCKRK